MKNPWPIQVIEITPDVSAESISTLDANGEDRMRGLVHAHMSMTFYINEAPVLPPFMVMELTRGDYLEFALEQDLWKRYFIPRHLFRVG